MDILVFQLADQRFGLPAEDVAELLPAVAITPLPRAPDIVEGIINVRGLVVPVLDIRARFGLPARAPSYRDHYVVARARERTVAIRADRAIDLVPVAQDAISNAAEALPASPYVRGVARLKDGMVLLHDLHAFLSQAEEASMDLALENNAS